MHPRHSRETLRPVDPRLTYSISSSCHTQSCSVTAGALRALRRRGEMKGGCESSTEGRPSSARVRLPYVEAKGEKAPARSAGEIKSAGGTRTWERGFPYSLVESDQRR